jgi:short-subunit dehydrogenase
LGLSSAKHLAGCGFNIVLIAETLEKLETTALLIQKIKTTTGKAPKTRVVVFDFSKQYTAADFSKMVGDRLSDIDVSILINAAESAQMGLLTELTNQ